MSPRPIRTPDEIAESRTAIISAAARVMAQSGYRGATVQAIAAEAGCSAPTLYNYFCGKEDILRGMVALVLDQLMAPFAEPVDPDAPPSARIAGLLRGVYVNGSALRDIMIAFAKLTAEACNTIIEGERMDGERLMTTAFVDWVAMHLSPEERGGMEPEAAGYLMHGISHSFFLRWMHQAFGGDLPAQAELAATLYCKAVAP